MRWIFELRLARVTKNPPYSRRAMRIDFKVRSSLCAQPSAALKSSVKRRAACQKQPNNYKPRSRGSDLIGQRNILAHEYGQIDHELLYKAATEDVHTSASAG